MFYKILITTQVGQYKNEYEKEATPKFAQCWEVYSMLLGISLPHVLNISNLASSFPMMVWRGHKKHNFCLTCSKGHYNPPEISLNLLCIAIKCFHRTREIRKKNVNKIQLDQ